DTDNSNQDNLEASNLKDPSHIEPAPIDEQQPHGDLVTAFEKLQVEPETEILTSNNEDKIPELTEEERQEKEAHAQELLTRRESLKQYFTKKQPYTNNNIHNMQIDNPAEDTSDTNTRRESLKEYFTTKRSHNKDNSISSSISEDIDDENNKKPLSSPIAAEVATTTMGDNNSNSGKDNTSSSQNTNADAEERRQKAAIARLAQRKQLMELKKQRRRQASEGKMDTEDIIITVPEKKKNSPANDESTTTTTGENDAAITPKSSTHSLEGNESDDSLDWDAILAQTSDLESGGIDSGLLDVVDDDDENFWNLEKIDTSELQRHLSPLTRSPEPNSRSNSTRRNNNTNIKDDDEFSHTLLAEDVDDITANSNTFPENSREEDEFDMTLDAQLTPILEPTTRGKNLDIDNMELDGRLSPATTPHRRLSPGPRNNANLRTRAISTVKEEEDESNDILLKVVTQEVDDITANSNNFPENSLEEDEFDMTLDVQMTSMIDPKSPSPTPSSRISLIGVKTGIPMGLPKPAFTSHFGSSPSSSRASSVADHDEYETMSNGSITSVLSSNSTKSASSIRRPYTTRGLRAPRTGTTGVTSKIATPNRQTMTSPTPSRPRSMSVVSNSSAEESTTSTASRVSSRRTQQSTPTRNNNTNQIPAPRQRTLSGASNSSRDDARAAVASKPVATPVRSLSRAGLNQTKLPSGISRPSSPTQIRGSPAGEGAGAARQTTLTRSATLHTTSNITPPSGLARPSSRAGISKTPGSATPSRPSSRLGTISESKSKTSALYNNKKPRPVSIAVSPNSAANRITSPTAISNIRPGSSMLRTTGISAYNGGRRSSDSLSSYEEYSLFSPPESPSNASETDSLTSLTSSVSYGSSPGRGTSPIPPTSLIGSPSIRKSGVGVTRSLSMSTPPSRLTPPSAAVTTGIAATTPSKLATPAGTQLRPPSSFGLRRPKNQS
ncbi:7218_t:CDS:2, partial [Ambispora leptoticha]